MSKNIIACLWGLAEACFFFIVPDVWLSIVGGRKFKQGLIACIWTLVGALIGGSIVYLISTSHMVKLLQFYEHIPGISRLLIQLVESKLHNFGVNAILFAPLEGIPYKLFAAQAYNAGISHWAFLAISIPARLIRFIAVVIVANMVLKLLDKFRIKINKIILLIAFWIVFYIFYFISMQN